MKDLVRRGMAEGRSACRRALLPPGSFAKTEEVIELAKVAAESGGLYTSHVRDEGNYDIGVLASVERGDPHRRRREADRHCAHEGARPGQLGARRTRSDMEQARARGVEVFADQYPYEASSTSLRAALVPGGVEPTGAIATETSGGAAAPTPILIAHYRPDPSIEARRSRKSPPRGVAGEGGDGSDGAGDASIVSFNMSEDDIAAIMRAPFTMASSDGGLVAVGGGKPHPRNYGAFARQLAVYVRERQ